MKQLKKILLPINAEYSTNKSYNFAISLAKIYQAEIIPIHIIEKETDYINVKNLANTTAKKIASKVQSRLKKEGVIAVAPLMQHGNPIEKIKIAAIKHDINVIVFGQTKPSPGRGMFLNHTIEKVISLSSKPVWVITEDFDRKIENILCPFDFSNESKHALANSIHLAQKYNSRLTILNVFPAIKNQFPWIDGSFKDETEESYNKNKDQFNSFLKDYSFPRIYWRSITRLGDPASEILSECIEGQYDLLMMGTAGHKRLSKLMLGSVTEKVIRQVPCSFITTKLEDIIDLSLETKINYLNHHYKLARQKQKVNLLDEAIDEYLNCLSVNEMHAPSLIGLSEVYHKLGDRSKETLYRRMAAEILDGLYKHK